MNIQEITKGADYRYQVDVDYDGHAETTTFRLGTTNAKVALGGTPDVSVTVAWGAFGTPVAGHTIGQFALTKTQTAGLTEGLYYFSLFSVGADTTPLGRGTVQVVA